jgi:hypothetical protein
MAVGPIVYYLAVILAIGGVLALAWHFQPKVSVVSEPSPLPSPSHKPTPKPVAPAYGPQQKPSPKPSPKASPTGSAQPASPAASASPAPAAVTSPEPSPSAAAPSPTPTPAPSATPSAKTGSVEVVIQERSWVEIRANGRAVYEGLMQPGTRKTVGGKDVEVTAGNAGGVRVFVNGQDKGVLGERGMVVTKTYNP